MQAFQSSLDDGYPGQHAFYGFFRVVGTGPALGDENHTDLRLRTRRGNPITSEIRVGRKTNEFLSQGDRLSAYLEIRG